MYIFHLFSTNGVELCLMTILQKCSPKLSTVAECAYNKCSSQAYVPWCQFCYSEATFMIKILVAMQFQIPCENAAPGCRVHLQWIVCWCQFCASGATVIILVTILGIVGFIHQCQSVGVYCIITSYFQRKHSFTLLSWKTRVDSGFMLLFRKLRVPRTAHFEIILQTSSYTVTLISLWKHYGEGQFNAAPPWQTMVRMWWV